MEFNKSKVKDEIIETAANFLCCEKVELYEKVVCGDKDAERAIDVATTEVMKKYLKDASEKDIRFISFDFSDEHEKNCRLNMERQIDQNPWIYTEQYVEIEIGEYLKNLNKEESNNSAKKAQKEKKGFFSKVKDFIFGEEE